MTGDQQGRHPHIILSGTGQAEPFQSTASPRSKPPPAQDRQFHGARLRSQLQQVQRDGEEALQAQKEAGLEGGLGIQVEFASEPDVELAFESLSRSRQGIELLNLRRDGGVTLATVFVPEGKLPAFEKIIEDYLAERRVTNGHSLDHKALVDTIREIRSATFDALWTDDASVLPEDDDLPVWWEIWLPVRDDRAAVKHRFTTVAERIGFQVSKRAIHFPERTVLQVRGSKRQFIQSMRLLNEVAEVRRAKETAEFFDTLSPADQHAWVQNLLSRTTFAHQDAPHVCMLDTGVNRRHPLLSSALAADDLHTIEPAWGATDQEGHGTQMAGLALYGDLTERFPLNTPIDLRHRLESVKLLPHNHANHGEPYGQMTIEAASRPEVGAPERRRIFSMAITARDNRDRGRPSAWSAAIDALACDAYGEGLTPRLFIQAAGNIEEPEAWKTYPASNQSDGVHDPGQAWNAITVGAYTEKITLTEPDTAAFQPVAPRGGLSPFSTTSLTWPKSPWPYKPDVVFEGGNAARDEIGPITMPSLGLLTTHFRPDERYLSVTNATSAASAQCARMGAEILAAYPNLWPETIRALIVHSAEWTEQMRSEFLDPRKRKQDYARLLRIVGYGVPNLERALWSLSNSLTLIVEDELQPFQLKEGSSNITARDMHLHPLPWPRDELAALGEVEVEMRVTLSYFIEPNPGVVERGTKGRYRYESHGLRFEVKGRAETVDQFRGRINLRARDEEHGDESGPASDADKEWRFGVRNRTLGSLHSDTWTGIAADLAERGVLAVYPALGWWKTAKKLEAYNKRARYALVISIKTPEVGVDLYNVVAQQITAAAAIEL